MKMSRLSPFSTDSWIKRAWQGARDIAQQRPRDSYFESQLVLEDEEASRRAFLQARERLLRPDSWKELGPKWGSARFEVKPAEERKDPRVRKGDLLKISLPGLPRATWVQVEKVTDEPDRVEVRVRPTGAPGASGVDHIFDESTTNTFTIERTGAKVIGQVHGQNEVANFSGSWWEDLLSATFLWGGWMGGKDHQWKPFVHNLLRGPNQVDSTVRPRSSGF